MRHTFSSRLTENWLLVRVPRGWILLGLMGASWGLVAGSAAKFFGA